MTHFSSIIESRLILTILLVFIFQKFYQMEPIFSTKHDWIYIYLFVRHYTIDYINIIKSIIMQLKFATDYRSINVEIHLNAYQSIDY